jgi:hypothetical protein
VRVGINGDGTPWSFRLGAVPETGTEPAIGTGEWNLDHGRTAAVRGGRSALAGPPGDWNGHTAVLSLVLVSAAFYCFHGYSALHGAKSTGVS